jgi:hypothetical protein
MGIAGQRHGRGIWSRLRRGFEKRHRERATGGGRQAAGGRLFPSRDRQGVGAFTTEMAVNSTVS